MAITSSVVTVEHAQIDGRRYVREVHSDAQGVAAQIDYLGPANAQTTAQSVANARALILNVTLADEEVLGKVEIDATPLPLRFQTAAEFLQRIRDIYRHLSREQLARLARWITRRIDAGDVTVAQLRNAWGLTLAQWNALETRMRALRTNIEAVDAAVGE
jgi:hypothetical protein